MALASTYSAAVEGVNAHFVTVEANVGPGLPGIHIVGLGDKAVGESRDRIRTAVANSVLPWPRTKIMVSLSPANLPKSGSHFDLPVALAVLASMDPRAERRLKRSLIVGELALSGGLRRVDGILQIIAQALHGHPDGGEIDHVIIPAGNAQEAALIGHPAVRIAHTLSEAWQWAIGESELPGLETVTHTVEPVRVPDFRDVIGQLHERRAMEIAAAGAHHMLMIGSPGSGKSMLAERLPSILPDLSPEQVVEATAIHSISGNSSGEVIMRAPFVAPHPSLGRAALIGGGSGIPRPGAVSHAHHGVLFLDEVSEIDARTLDALRVPLEKGEVQLTRARRVVVYPANFQLIMAANPCRCGVDNAAKCECSSGERAKYLRNLSGPLRDRIDICLNTTSVGGVVTASDQESSAVIAQRVLAARDRSQWRWAKAGLSATTNGRVPGAVLRRDFPAAEDGMGVISTALADGMISQRGVDRLLRLSWTLADLAGVDTPRLAEVMDALSLRETEQQGVAA
ncbi:YifB family Mg chelatase-like AAA ATPase [Corynebacterium tuscaniense]|uniref:YifB family Mg chelatase-like AAA ATPase n=1 Tax=Corynebacterium tuscaniense TaxID=302449 RepID=UPI00050D97FE|nr:YifB family Mg chelatase-like AAA ATPase [Corynebacterium tuscaniense]KAA8746787.1 YifB family Mg chelatase-like AAA ATPase [Corynebacterium tuscaniense]KGF25156.1 ATPase [Corynebacterium tuscaniense DNF00037]